MTGVPSLIGPDLHITGNLKCNGDLQIDGIIEGDIDSKMVTVGEGAEVKGVITAETARICGKLKGSVRSASVILTKTAQIEGDIVHDSLAVEAEAHIDGNIKRLSAAAGESQKRFAS